MTFKYFGHVKKFREDLKMTLEPFLQEITNIGAKTAERDS